MTSPIAPDDTAALHDVAAKTVRSERLIDQYVVAAVARAVCPADCVVVRTDDLRAVLEDWWEAGHDAPPVYTSEGVKPYWGEREQAIYDRLRGKVDGV